ncbi:MAG: ATP-dependent helicase [Chitinophagales bacterium]|nr:ATP-dependent helicase [Chitinophagales bacterium]
MQPMFDFRKIIVTDEDIQAVEKFLGIQFNEGQKKVIRFWDTVDIQACPGSGKTTTLAAKLIILINKLPQGFQQGVCIITHTNIAVREIKEKLGHYANFYSRYPNHFGTIQSFVDKYLAIPAYKNEFKKAPKIIDDQVYSIEIRKLPILQKTGTLNYLDVKNIEPGYLSFNKQEFIVAASVNNPTPLTVPGISADKWKVHYDRIVSAKTFLLAEGYLKYDEAYAIAFKALRNNQGLKKIFELRFPIIFIDEMQDMELHQSEIITDLFGNSKSVIQKIGDVNQAIYSRVNSDGAAEWKPVINPELQLKQSNRIANNLADLVKGICVSPQEMEGWINPEPIKPVVIVYTAASINQVKDKFAELIFDNNLMDKGIIKCIGSRISESKLNINSYWNDFNRQKIKTELSNLNAYLHQINKLLKLDKNTRESRKLFLEIFCKALKLCKVKNPNTNFYFTPYSLIDFLVKTDKEQLVQEINLIISNWIIGILKQDDIEVKVVEFIDTLLVALGGAKNEDATFFLTDKTDNEENGKVENKVYKYQKNGREIEIHFDTIHGVKGETHTATLYIECFLRIFDIGGKVVKFISSDEKGREKLRKEDACKKQLPMAYVALTRATHFFSIAIDKERFDQSYHEYFEANKDFWEVCHI